MSPSRAGSEFESSLIPGSSPTQVPDRHWQISWTCLFCALVQHGLLPGPACKWLFKSTEGWPASCRALCYACSIFKKTGICWLHGAWSRFAAWRERAHSWVRSLATAWISGKRQEDTRRTHTVRQVFTVWFCFSEHGC